MEPVAPPSVSTGEGDPAGDVNAWLDVFPDSSVAYVSFGTMMVPPPPHAAVLAAALERSGTPFVWAAATATLPDGFEDRAAAAGTRLVRVGLAASWGGFGAVPEADELARALGAGMRARTVEIAAGMAEAIGEGGSSRRELDGLVQELGRGR